MVWCAPKETEPPLSARQSRIYLLNDGAFARALHGVQRNKASPSNNQNTTGFAFRGWVLAVPGGKLDFLVHALLYDRIADEFRDLLPGHSHGAKPNK